MPPVNEELDEELEQDNAATIPSGMDDDDDDEISTDPVAPDPVDDDEELEQGDEQGADDEQQGADDEQAAEGAETETPDPATAKPDDEQLEDEGDEELEEEPYTALEGAVRYKGQGVFIPETAIDRLEAALNGATGFDAERTELTAQIEELREVRSAEAEVAADVLTLVFKDFAEMDEDALYEWAVKFKRDLPQLRADIREAHIKKREEELERREKAGATRGARAAAAEAQPTMTREQALENARGAVAPMLEALYKEPALAALTPGDKKVLLERISGSVEQYIRVAQDDSMAEHGIKKGDAYLDAEAARQRALERAEVRAEAKQQLTVRERIVRKNRRKLGKEGARRTGGSGGRTAATDGDGEWKPAETREEWLKRMEMD